jgi:hypothetical protein
MAPPGLVIVSGFTAAGKTTHARQRRAADLSLDLEMDRRLTGYLHRIDEPVVVDA